MILSFLAIPDHAATPRHAAARQAAPHPHPHPHPARAEGTRMFPRVSGRKMILEEEGSGVPKWVGTPTGTLAAAKMPRATSGKISS